LSGEPVNDDFDEDEQEEDQPQALEIEKEAVEDNNLPSKEKDASLKPEESKVATEDNKSTLDRKKEHRRKISYNSVALFNVLDDEQKTKPPTLDNSPPQDVAPEEEVVIEQASLAQKAHNAKEASKPIKVVSLGSSNKSLRKKEEAKASTSAKTTLVERKTQPPTKPLSKKSEKNSKKSEKSSNKSEKSSKARQKRPKAKGKKVSAVLARNFKIKRLNRIYKRCLKEKDGHPMYKNSNGLVLWWYKELEMWMISKEELVGTDKSYAFTRDIAVNPNDINNKWKTYNKVTKRWDPDPGTISSPAWLSDEKEQDHLTLAELKMLATNEVTQAEPPADVQNRRKNDGAAGEKEDIVVWKVVLSGFRVPKLNNVYLLQENLINGRPHFKSSSGRIVLWWFHRRRFWMLSPQRLVGSDQSYACIEHTGEHPKDVEGMWQVYDRNLKKFVKNEGAAIQPGVAEKISLRGFSKVPNLNGVFIETRNWMCNRPTFLKYDAEANVALVLFYRNSTKQWCVTKDGEIGSTPIVSCEEPGMHPRDYKDRRVWRDALDNILLGVVG